MGFFFETIFFNFFPFREYFKNIQIHATAETLSKDTLVSGNCPFYLSAPYIDGYLKI